MMQLTAIFTYAEEGGFIAVNPETGTTTQGESIEEALQNLQEATALYLEEFPLTLSKASLVTSFTLQTNA
jgi:predicted RNase H-like HicB family nuclease